MKRKSYSKEFKTTLVELLHLGRTTTELSEEYSVRPDVIRRWKREYKENNGNFLEKKVLSIEEQEIKYLKKELREIKMERDILKKAVGIFSKNDSINTNF